MFGRNVDATDERLEILVTPQRELRFLGDRRDDRKDDECSNCGSCLGAASHVGTWICFQGLLHSVSPSNSRHDEVPSDARFKFGVRRSRQVDRFAIPAAILRSPYRPG
jgi:hypothetical protein